MKIYSKLKLILTAQERRLLLGLLIFSILISLIEIIGIAAIMPFIAVATNFELIQTNKYYLYIYMLLNFHSSAQFVIIFGISLIFFYFFRCSLNVLYFYLLSRFSYGRHHSISSRLFNEYLSYSYKSFINKDTSKLTKIIISDTAYLAELIKAILIMLSEILIVLLLYCILLSINWKITIFITFFIVLNALLLTKTVSKKIKKAGIRRSDFQKKLYTITNSSFGNFKIIKLIDNKIDILRNFSNSSYGLSKANVVHNSLYNVPRLFLETIGFCIISAIVIYFVWKYQTNITSIISIISIFVLALYRFLPSINRIMTNYNIVMFYYSSLNLVHDNFTVNSEKLGDDIVDFNKSLRLDNVCFAYNKKVFVIQDVNLIINKGEKVAFVGESGAGKSTLADIIMGLYFPTGGKTLVDGQDLSEKNIKDWRSKIGYIPQSIYLFDGTVGENVTLGRKYNENKIDKVLKQAHIYDFLQTKKGKDTRVGEGGIKLSGGQKQRIAIARALYSDPEILVLDEATSALD